MPRHIAKSNKNVKGNLPGADVLALLAAMVKNIPANTANATDLVLMYDPTTRVVHTSTGTAVGAL